MDILTPFVASKCNIGPIICKTDSIKSLGIFSCPLKMVSHNQGQLMINRHSGF